MSLRRVQDDTLSLSFTDVLTCVLGAAIALFLIFIAITTLSTIQGAITANSSGFSHNKMKSIQENINAGFATTSLKFISHDEKLINILTTSVQDTENEFPNVKISDLNIIQGDDKMYGVHIDFFNNLVIMPFKLPDDFFERDRNIFVKGLISVGGMVSCLEINFNQTAVINNRNSPLFRVGPGIDGFIDSKYASVSCL